ncbi:hypothetical protein KK141_11415 [Dyella sp. LX-66]|uniref:hypothetical protein n=1 Tax=unclassified Dyella TaxID=2634549 RepID=UPI001BE07766|nr:MULTISPECIES: hypothetical protein [unclassified Dyella]MBT2118868.1 hypothetical protein [Dyella sp. LX-1]MBT2140139.1 hypothetical protein [Dyella sp. LX-66]
MSFADIALIFDLLHAVALCSPMVATEYDPGASHTREQVLGGFSTLHKHGLISSEIVTDASGYRTIDFCVHGLSAKGRRVYQVMLQTQLAFESPRVRVDPADS